MGKSVGRLNVCYIAQNKLISTELKKKTLQMKMIAKHDFFLSFFLFLVQTSCDYGLLFMGDSSVSGSVLLDYKVQVI